MKRNINPKVIAAGLFNVAEQNDDLDGVRDALGLLNRVVMESGQFRVLIQSKKNQWEIESRNPQLSLRPIISSFSQRNSILPQR